MLRRVLVSLGLLAVSGAASASTSPIPNLSSTDPGDFVEVSLVADHVIPGPGEIEFTLTWGPLDQPELSVAAAVLQAVFAPGAGFALASGEDGCSELVGAAAGSCTLRLLALSATSGPTLVASAQLHYQWIAPPGYELCAPGDPQCVSAGQQVFLLVTDETVLGVPVVSGNSSSFGTAGDPRVRPIPEPGSAALVALGLAGLARRRREGASMR